MVLVLIPFATVSIHYVQTLSTDPHLPLLGKTLELQYEQIPERVYFYTEGEGDRHMTTLQVQLAVTELFFKYNLDEVIVARTVAGLSFRNPAERWHAIANLGLQGVGLMRERMETKGRNLCQGATQM